MRILTSYPKNSTLIGEFWRAGSYSLNWRHIKRSFPLVFDFFKFMCSSKGHVRNGAIRSEKPAHLHLFRIGNWLYQTCFSTCIFLVGHLTFVYLDPCGFVDRRGFGILLSISYYVPYCCGVCLAFQTGCITCVLFVLRTAGKKAGKRLRYEGLTFRYLAAPIL